MNRLAIAESVLRCRRCGAPLRFSAREELLCCGAEGGSWEGGIFRYDPALREAGKPEMHARDRQAEGYLAHSKFPTQIHRMRRFIASVSPPADGLPVLDLACGPGPATGMLRQAGFPVLAADISYRSLEVNRDTADPAVAFVHADLTNMKFVDGSVGGLMMADFLQHLGAAEAQRGFLRNAFTALKPGGWFFLSFFNVNLKHRLRANIEGSFGVEIAYRRLEPREVVGMLPPGVEVRQTSFMNIFHEPLPDTIASVLPFARHLARMAILTGRKSL